MEDIDKRIQEALEITISVNKRKNPNNTINSLFLTVCCVMVFYVLHFVRAILPWCP